MAETKPDTWAPPPRKQRRRWLRILVWILGVFIVLLVVVYFVATSAAFLKGVILPKVSKAVNADITVADASISPFKQVVLHNLKVQSAGQEPLLTATEVRLRYSLMDIIGGNIHVEEATVTSPTIALVENADGTSNLDPLLKSQKEKAKAPEAKPEPPAKPSKPLRVDLKKLAVTDATIRRTKLYNNNKSDVAELSNVNLSVEDVKNGQAGKLLLEAAIKVENNPPAPATNGLLQARLNGKFDFSLTPDLKPASIQGNTHLDISRAAGAMAELATLGADLDCDVTPTDVKQVALRFQKGGTRLGELRVSGPFDMEKTEGKLTVQVLNIDRQVLNLAGAKNGIDFGPTTVNSSNQIQIARAGSAITAVGQFNLNQFQVTRTNQTTPPLDLRAEYNVAVDRDAENALLRALTLTANQKGNALLRGELTSPMTIAWGKTANAVGDSALNVTLTRFDLADWKPFIGDVAPAGEVNAKLQLASKQAGKQLTFDLNTQVANLTARAGTNQITQANISLSVKGQAADLKQFNLSEYKCTLAKQDQQLATLSGSGTYDLATTNADLQVTAQLMLAKLLQAFPQPDLSIASGTADLKAHITQKQTAQNVSGSFALNDFTGQFGSNALRNFSTAMDLDVGVTPELVTIRKVTGKLASDGKPGGNFDLSGTYASNKAAQLTAKLTDFNQNGLGPFLQAMLVDKKLQSVALDATASVQYSPQGDSAVKADLQVTNLVVIDPKNQIPATPLEARLGLDTSLSKQVAKIRQVQLTLTPTDRAKNQLSLQGQVDMSDTTNITGNLKLAADSLDVTKYYDLFVSTNKPAESQPVPADRRTGPAPAPAPGKPAPEKEPEPMRLPLRNFVAEMNVGRFYLHEVEITNLAVTTKLDGGKVLVRPCQLALNGAPVKADVDADLGVPGFKYGLAFNADHIPLAPLVNTFQPERRGQIGGTLSAQMTVNGAGITGPSLQKNLASKFDIASTNLNLAIPSLRSKLLKSVVEVIAIIPDLLKNRDVTAAAGSLVGSLLGGRSGETKGGLMDDLMKNPIDVIQAQGNVANGLVTLDKTLVQSVAFQADAHGTVKLADVLTNSQMNIPLTIALQRSLAEKINFVPAGTPTNVAYVKLPDYVALKGTVGDPKKDINYKALLGTALQQVGSSIPGVDQKTGSLIQGLGSALTGRSQPQAGATNAPSPAPPTTNASPAGNLLDQLLKPRKK